MNANGHGSLSHDSGPIVNGSGPAKSEKVRPIKLKSSGDKSFAGKTSNAVKSNGTKSTKRKSASKSKPVKEDSVVEEAEPVYSGHLMPDVAQTAALPASPAPWITVPAISFSTTIPESGELRGRSIEDERRNFVRANRVSLVLGLVAICLGIALVLAMLQLGSRNSQLASKKALENATTTALAAARTYSTELASYSYQHLDQEFGTVEANSTPSFQQSYTKTSGALKSILIKYHSTAQATILSAGLVSATTTRGSSWCSSSRRLRTRHRRTPRQPAHSSR